MKKANRLSRYLHSHLLICACLVIDIWYTLLSNMSFHIKPHKESRVPFLCAVDVRS